MEEPARALPGIGLRGASPRASGRAGRTTVSRAPSFLCGALLLVIVSATSPAAAANARPTNRRVELVVARPPEEMRQFEAALRDVLVTKGLGLASARKDTITPEDVALATTASVDEAASIVARVFVDFTVSGHATLFLIDPRRGRIHVRRVTLDHGFDSVARAERGVRHRTVHRCHPGGAGDRRDARGIPAQRRRPSAASAAATAGRSQPSERPSTDDGGQDAAAAGGRLRRRGHGVWRLPARREGRVRGAARPRPDRRRGACRGAHFGRGRRRAGPALDRRPQRVRRGEVAQLREPFGQRRPRRRSRHDAGCARGRGAGRAGRGRLLGRQSVAATVRRDRAAVRQDLGGPRFRGGGSPARRAIHREDRQRVARRFRPAPASDHKPRCWSARCSDRAISAGLRRCGGALLDRTRRACAGRSARATGPLPKQRY